jgi:phospholipid/cholesterol/gamma-HCH transport system ATP-binding protein
MSGGDSDTRVTNPRLSDPDRSDPRGAASPAASPAPDPATGGAALPPQPRDGASERAHEGQPHDGDARAGERRADGRAPAEGKERRIRASIRDALRDPDAEARPRAEDPGPAKGAIIELERVHLGFGDRTILEDVSFLAQRGETIAVVGESGTGKSTTLKLILRHLQPDSGRVYVDGEDISGLSFSEALRVRKRMGMVFQGAALFDSMSVYENVAYPLREHTDYDETEIERRVREKLEFVDLEPDRVMEQLPSELSGGMRKRVGVARAIANDPQIMLYDEPTSGLDPLTTGTITRLIMKLQRELGVTSIVVSHDIRSVFRMASYVAVLADKRIRFFGTPEEMAACDDRYIQDFLGGF